MSKSKRLLELMLTVNRKRKFTVKELALEFGVSSRTILRDLQELGELGVPLYSEVGPHGGYQVLNERILPPIAFTEEEAVALFFACHALRHYSYIPFETEASSALGKFYHYMSGDVRDRIDQMKNRVDFVVPARQAESPYLSVLLEAAVMQQTVRIGYKSQDTLSERNIQPIGIYASSGLWYCPAYCFLRGGVRLFRCDRIESVKEGDPVTKPLDLRSIHLDNWEDSFSDKSPNTRCRVQLSEEGVRVCEAELGRRGLLRVREDGTGWIDGDIPNSEIPYFARLFIGLGSDAEVTEPPELIECMRSKLKELLAKYDGQDQPSSPRT
ncbi:helix-turn-helix transcriptional regulator [Paenibacillus rhizophilus]|uniref:YafY family transcriptional regulator n=1 Tax=Paenibacillus rhizophilus TaxID=1850366 RepID=A0A3N9P504_9BACL|nr:YafY family protein [Paenibacillus rhizophilus]RQW10154.1 YafY family transcriptional regulator [Paenibacillus rhizophilus]